METIVEASDRYVDGQIARGKISELTGRNLRVAFRILERTAQSAEVRRLSEDDVDAWFAAHAGLARSTVRTRLSMLRGFARWTVKTGRCPVDWTADIDSPRVPRREPRALEQAQAAALLAAAPDGRGRVMVGLMLWCGLRCCEVVALDVSDWTGDVVYVRGKGDKSRTVPVPVEQAIARTIPDARKIEVDTQAIKFTRADGERLMYFTPPIVESYVIAFDAGDPMGPFKFRIQKPLVLKRRLRTETGRAETRERRATKKKETDPADARTEPVAREVEAVETEPTSARTEPVARGSEANLAVGREAFARLIEPATTTTEGQKSTTRRVFKSNRREYGHRALRINQ